MKLPNLLLAILVLTTGCKNFGGGSDLAGVATASALVVALPLIPLAETYHIVNRTGKKQKVDKEYLMSVFDPIYAERTRLISERSPEDDALVLIDQGIVVYFPSSNPNSDQYNVYPGVFMPGSKNELIKDMDDRANYEKIMSNELGRYLWNLMSKDPSHESLETTRSNLYLSNTFRAFIAARFDYMERFNLTVFRSIEQDDGINSVTSLSDSTP